MKLSSRPARLLVQRGDTESTIPTNMEEDSSSSNINNSSNKGGNTVVLATITSEVVATMATMRVSSEICELIENEWRLMRNKRKGKDRQLHTRNVHVSLEVALVHSTVNNQGSLRPLLLPMRS